MFAQDEYGCKKIMVKNLQSHGIFLGKSWKNRSKIMAFNNVSKSSIKESHAMPTVFIRDGNAMKIRKKIVKLQKSHMKSHVEL